jgi:hypothetical protein
MNTMPSAAYLSECFVYVDGVLYWRRRPRQHFISDASHLNWNAKHAGKIAGRQMTGKGAYWQVMVDGLRYLNHRVIARMFGLSVDGVIDHIDRNVLNNRIENLRACTHRQNTLNNGGWRKRSLHRGVYQSGEASRGRWIAMIKIDGKNRSLGTFSTIEEAAEARRAGERKHYGEFSVRDAEYMPAEVANA